jgi:hypothetical protein
MVTWWCRTLTTGLGMADEVHAVHRLEDETERHQADHEHAGAEGHRPQAAERGHACPCVVRAPW